MWSNWSNRFAKRSEIVQDSVWLILTVQHWIVCSKIITGHFTRQKTNRALDGWAGYLPTVYCRKQNLQMSSIVFFQQQSSSIVCTACELLCTSDKDDFISIYIQNSIIKGETPLPGATLHNFPHILAWLSIVMHYLFWPQANCLENVG